MKFIADFHIHSKYSRATSPKSELPVLAKTAQQKGVNVLTTGDFTHPGWLRHIKDNLEQDTEGIYKLKSGVSKTRFILTTEISCIYSKKGKVRKIHILVFAPNIETVEKLNKRLAMIGNLKADGRPILGLDAKELLKIVLDVSQDCLVVPAHCLLPETYLHSSSGVKMIKNISIGDRVYTHEGRFKKVKKVYTRFYKGKIYNIRPYYFEIGLKTTPEHPFYGIKSYKYCPTMGCKTICKKDCASNKRERCPHKYFERYQPQWIQAKNLEEGDILIFPRFNNKTKDIREIKISQYLEKKDYKIEKDFIRPSKGTRRNLLPNTIKVDKNFCKLIGYYLSEGYTDSRDSISFCFNEKEKEYIEDVKKLMRDIFHFSYYREYKRRNKSSIELIFFSKILAIVFGKLFYNDSKIKRAHTKCLPSWALDLPIEKQAEIFKSWWYGDTGATSSRELMNQMKIILLRIGIVPSISKQSKKDFNKKYIHKIKNRVIRAQYDQFIFYGLSFFQDPFRLLKTPEFKKFNTKLKRRHGWIDDKYIYIPIKNIEKEYYEGKVYNLEVEEDNSYLSEFAAIHNCWTPWFSLFGSRSGFDSIEECFEDYSKYIFAGETGLSASPEMFWRMPDGRALTLISNSDAHSPSHIAREANVFDTELSYPAIIEAIKQKDPKKFLYTIEFFPQEGKYHYDGHRKCGISLSPKETKKYNGICPRCGRPLTVGVLNRVEELADREEGFKPKGAIPFKSLIPLKEVLAEVLDVGPNTKTVQRQYQGLIEKFGSEFNVLLKVPLSNFKGTVVPEIIEAIKRVRQGKVYIEPGYDGEYGKIKIFSARERQQNFSGQKTLF